MDYLNAGREALRRFVQKYEHIDPRPEVFSSGVTDEDRGIYMSISYGWDGKKRVKSTQFLVSVKDGKFFVVEDWTKESVATELLEAGVPSDKIVLAFHHPSMRACTEFAVA